MHTISSQEFVGWPRATLVVRVRLAAVVLTVRLVVRVRLAAIMLRVPLEVGVRLGAVVWRAQVWEGACSV